MAVSLGAQALGYSGLVMWPLESPYVWVALIGFGLGACFALSLILTLDHCRKPSEAAQLAGFVQGAGFLVNAVSPYKKLKSDLLPIRRRGVRPGGSYTSKERKLVELEEEALV